MLDTYKNFINNILETRGRFNCGTEYHERHHILPKSLGGTNEESNLIDLFPQEHYLAHKLLLQEDPTNEKLINAYALMTFMKKEGREIIQITPEEYAEARKAFSDSLKEKWKDKEYRELQTNILYDRWKDPGYRRKQSESRTRLNYKMWSDPDFKARMSEKLKERWVNSSEEYKQKSKDTMQQVSNQLWTDPDYIKKHCTPIYCIETQEYFFKQQDAISKYGVNPSGLSWHLAGRQKSAGKHPVTGEPLHWKKITWEEYYSNAPDTYLFNEIDLLRNNAS